MCLGVVCSCLGSACVGCCCSGLKDCQAKHGPASRVGYIFFMFVMCLYAVIMTIYGDTVLFENDLLNYEFVVCDQSNEACQSNGSVYRVSFCLFLFFIIHALVIKCSFASFHWLFLTWKIMTFIIILVVTYFIPNDPFDAYATFARFASFVFLLLQVVILISWAYDVNDRVIEKIDEMNGGLDEDSGKIHKAGVCCVQFGLVFATICIYIGIIVFIILQFTWFDAGTDCTFNSTILGLTIVIILIVTVAPIMLQTGSLFTTAVVAFYICYLCYAGLENYPEANCNTFARDETTATMWVGIIVTTIAISYIGFSVSNKSGLLLENGGAAPTESNINMELEAGTNKKNRGKDTGDDAGTAEGGDSNYDDNVDLGKSNYDDAEVKKGTPEEDLSPSQQELERKANVMFHLCMSFAAIYMAMLYTNWGTNTYNEDDSRGRGYESVWVNIAAQWVTFILFTWTAIAPKVCPSRFGQQNDDE